MVREACRAGTALDKAIGEAVREALAAGDTWPEIGRVLAGGVGEDGGRGADGVRRSPPAVVATVLGTGRGASR